MALLRIGDVLTQEKVITSEQLRKALEEKKPDERLGETLIRLSYATEGQILKALENSTGVQRVSLAKYSYNEKVFSMVDEKFCMRNNIIPLKIEGKKLYFATSDPLDFSVFEELRAITGLKPVAFSSTRREIETEIAKYYGFSRTLEALGTMKSVVEQEVTFDPTPMVQLVNQILTSAIFQRASDIHIDPLDDRVVVRYRVDGALDTVREFPVNIRNQMTSRIKIMAGMDITETRIPQDGRIQTTISGRNIDLRISTLPTVSGEKIVMRILDLSNNLYNISYLGLSPKEEKQILKMISRPNGMVLVSGPTGSGKTTTLYACLNELNKPTVNIITVEDPVEIRMEGVNQVQVRQNVKLTFANALRSILRQDPNIIMIGEIRDLETAEIAVRASLTGHLVLSTIHTNDAVKTVTRLLDMKIEPYLIASSLTGIISQRLVRRLCTECTTESDATASEIDFFAKHNIKIEKLNRAKGCPTCNFKGYAGRIGVYEILEINEAIRILISENASVVELEREAKKQGMKTLMESCLAIVKDGTTTLEEVMKVTYE